MLGNDAVSVWIPVVIRGYVRWQGGGLGGEGKREGEGNVYQRGDAT